jgi:hypothetical protein
MGREIYDCLKEQRLWVLTHARCSSPRAGGRNQVTADPDDYRSNALWRRPVDLCERRRRGLALQHRTCDRKWAFDRHAVCSPGSLSSDRNHMRQTEQARGDMNSTSARSRL